MIKQNNNNSQPKTLDVSEQDTLLISAVSTQDCNTWIKNNPEKIVNLYLQSVLKKKKKSVQTTLNELVKTERAHNISKFITEESLGTLKKLTQKNQISFSDWKQESELTSSKISSVAKKLNPIQIESVDQFIRRGGVIKTVKNRKNTGV